MARDTTHARPLLSALEQLEPHAHLCSIYETPEERFAVAVPFIKIGLDRGEKCLYIVDDGAEAAVQAALSAGDIDVDLAIATGKLALEKKETVYLKQGSFDPEWMFTFWADATADATRQGFPALRATGETEWVLRATTGLERWMEYESRLTHMLAKHACVLLCQYNRRHFAPDLILDIIRTHPTIIYRGVVSRNMYYVPADEFLSPDHAERELERLLTNMREREEIESTLRRQRNELSESEKRWRSVFENSAVGMAIADGAAHIVASNQALQELLGYSSEELQQLTVYDITHEADVPRNVELRSELLAGARREMQMEKRYRRKDGQLIWVRVTSSLIPGTARTPLLVIALVEDITARHQAERDLDASLSQSRALAGRLMHAQDDERRRIAQMLHETTAQDLAALKMYLARLNRTIGDWREPDRDVLTESISLAEQAIKGIRTLSYVLHPPFLDEMGLLSALRWYASGFAGRSGIKVDLDLPEPFERLPLDTETALFRIVQESLTNIHRHAGSEIAHIRLRSDSETLVMEIEDRGHGIPDASLKHILSGGAGVGVAGMSERIEELGGRLDITSSNQGTLVRVVLPLGNDVG